MERGGAAQASSHLIRTCTSIQDGFGQFDPSLKLEYTDI
jgi:hypothetical protein